MPSQNFDNSLEYIDVPKHGASMTELAVFASTYNGYERFCSDTHQYEKFFSEVERRYFDQGSISDDLGLDFLRAWLFLVYRRDHMGGSSREQDELWRLLVMVIRLKSGGRVLVLT